MPVGITQVIKSKVPRSDLKRQVNNHSLNKREQHKLTAATDNAHNSSPHNSITPSYLCQIIETRVSRKLHCHFGVQKTLPSIISSKSSIILTTFLHSQSHLPTYNSPNTQVTSTIPANIPDTPSLLNRPAEGVSVGLPEPEAVGLAVGEPVPEGVAVAVLLRFVIRATRVMLTGDWDSMYPVKTSSWVSRMLKVVFFWKILSPPIHSPSAQFRMYPNAEPKSTSKFRFE